jgi:hypothetical protein
MSEIAVAPSPKPCPECGLVHPEIFLRKADWSVLQANDPAAFTAFKQAVFDHYRATGYPQYVLTDAQKTKVLRRLAKGGYVMKNDVVTQNMYGLNLAWSYHPHYINVECNGMRTVAATWNDDDLLKKVIDKRIKYGAWITDSGMRKAVRSFTGTQAVSNFRPTAAAAIYDRWLPAEGGVTWDMSMGWGGRLLGAVACSKVKKYIGCDPATETFAGLTAMDADIKRLLPERQLETQLLMVGSETKEMHDALPQGGVDLCFTSPPYFDCEKYTYEKTQSWVKYQRDNQKETRDAWLTEFMGATLDNCDYALKSGGILAINIADVNSYGGMEADFLHFAQWKGWEFIGESKLSLSRMMGTRNKHTGTHKFEPIFVFRKK